MRIGDGIEGRLADREPPDELQRAVSKARGLIEEHFPGLWPAVDAGLAVCATLLLQDNANPVALVYVGPPASGKTTVADLFAQHALAYRSDTFTPAAFVSNSANVKKIDLEDIDLLPRIRHKVLVTPELAPIFRGDVDNLVRQFATLVRVLDGQGLMTDMGTHGRRGYAGDYLFAWLGCTTPIPPNVWELMAQLGSRLFFLTMEPHQDVTIEGLVATLGSHLSYRESLEVCRSAVEIVLSELVSAYGAPCPEQHDVGCAARAVVWPRAQDSLEARTWIARLARVVAAMRSVPTKEDDDSFGFTPGHGEAPHRALNVLYNLARGHALVHGRSRLTHEDLAVVAAVAVSSMGTAAGKVFAALVKSPDGRLSVAQVKQALGVKHHGTASAFMEQLDHRGVLELVATAPGQPKHLQVRDEWAWCTSPEFRDLLGVGLVNPPGVCVPLATDNLAKRQRKQEEMEEAHTPEELTGVVDGEVCEGLQTPQGEPSGR